MRNEFGEEADDLFILSLFFFSFGKFVSCIEIKNLIEFVGVRLVRYGIGKIKHSFAHNQCESSGDHHSYNAPSGIDERNQNKRKALLRWFLVRKHIK